MDGEPPFSAPCLLQTWIYDEVQVRKKEIKRETKQESNSREVSEFWLNAVNLMNVEWLS